MSAEPGSAAPTMIAHASPVFGGAALAVLGAMLFLIVALTVLLVQTTWVNPASASDVPPALHQGGLVIR
ncbi:MAG: hypothetical protein ABI766_11975 [Gemmatimonadales bacterium]